MDEDRMTINHIKAPALFGADMIVHETLRKTYAVWR
jgi:hypothetical protein